MGQEAGTVENAEIAGILAGSFDLVTAVRVLAAAVLALGRTQGLLSVAVGRLEAEKRQAPKAQPVRREAG